MTREGGALRCAAKAQKDTEMKLADNPASPIEQPFIMVTGHKRPFKMASNNDIMNKNIATGIRRWAGEMR